ncbi:hypothetical protein HPP92_000804 [Vanilla planifolia]|uniref:Pectin acetylesterase n=1 Tax=Vanilla planifolia TaxID=51239 RepID=A0A835S236_VANPL|nr:hypothetical protein HPP92_000804 [Vanilla planifolia]
MAINNLRLWFRRWWGRDRTTPTVRCALVLVVFVVAISSWKKDRGKGVMRGVEGPLLGSLDPTLVDLTLVRDAKAKGALCLDGSSPGYHVQRGDSFGSDNWLLHLEGGGWCNSVESCALRSRTALGSSRFMQEVHFVGILSPYPSQNPDFYNWNRVKIRYCDGASFMGNVQNINQSGSQIFFRGERVWEAIIDQLKLEGLAKAKKAFLTGCSAGGLAALMHCDNFQAHLPQTKVKCLADAGFFLNEKDISGRNTIKAFYDEVIHLQDVTKSLPNNCSTMIEPWQCFFPYELIKRIQTPIFILNPAYDFWQIQHILVPTESDLKGHWGRCRMNIRYCNSNQIEILQGFRKSLLHALSEFQHNSKVGLFINSCFIHCQTISNITWHSPMSPRINNKTIAEAVGDWFFENRDVKEVDCPYPCNPTCFHMEFI